jgi:hypothetical protein
VEYLFDLERAVEAVEARVPFGAFIIKVLLSMTCLYLLLFLTTRLAIDYFWPVARFLLNIVSNISYSRTAAQVQSPGALSYVLGLVTMIAAVASMSGILSSQYKKIREIKADIQNVRAGMGASFYDVGLASVTINDPRQGDRVPYHKTVKGTLQPAGSSIQVFVQAGLRSEPWWYRQSAPIVTKGSEWAARCTFGDPNSPTGSDFKLRVVIRATPVIERRVKDLPTDGWMSEIIAVQLDRDLPDN